MGFSQLPSRLMPIRSYVRSTDCNGVSHRQNISTCVDIPVVVCSAVGTVPLSDIQRQFIQNMSAVPTAFRARKPTVNFYQVSTVPRLLVFQLPHQLRPCGITDSTGKLGILNHVFNCQILNHYRLVFTHRKADLVNSALPPLRFFLNLGYLALPAKKLVKAVCRCLKPCCNGTQLTSFKN